MTYPKRVLIAIDQLFCDDMHCASAYITEMTCTQNAREYRG